MIDEFTLDCLKVLTQICSETIKDEAKHLKKTNNNTSMSLGFINRKYIS